MARCLAISVPWSEVIEQQPGWQVGQACLHQLVQVVAVELGRAEQPKESGLPFATGHGGEAVLGEPIDLDPPPVRRGPAPDPRAEGLPRTGRCWCR